MLKPASSRSSHRCSRRGGFTLVEVLVTIAIIAIIAGVAFGPITSALRKGKQSVGLQTAHTLSIAEFAFSEDNNNYYPDTSNPAGNTGTGAAAVAQPLLAGRYVTDTAMFFLTGSAEVKYTGTSPATDLAPANISWDFVGYGGPGLNQNTATDVPVLWSSVASSGPAPDLTSTSAVTATVSATSPFSDQGMAIAYKDNTSKFLLSTATAPPPAPRIVTLYTTGPGLAGATVLPGGG